ncbi:MAG: protoglobin domain-containing protein [Gammaproteobacteria bacterium]|nr:protoglobin domain-containing protein [Gammaproteobacteria bacterium]
MTHDEFSTLGLYAKVFSDLTPQREALIAKEGKRLEPYLVEITDKFYGTLQKIPNAQPFIQGRVDHLKQTHLNWLRNLISGNYGVTYVEQMYTVGYVHVQVDLPAEFMAGGTTLIANEFYRLVPSIYHDNAETSYAMIQALNACLGFSLIIMQTSYQASISEVKDKFLAITGMSQKLYEKLAAAYDGKH